MKPTLPEALRFAGGTRLRVEVTLKPLLREAVEKALARHALSLMAIETAVVVVRMNEAHFGEIVGEIENADDLTTATIAAIRSDSGDYAFNLVATHAGRQRNAEARDVMLQVVGRSEVYFSRVTAEGPVAFAKLRYVPDDGPTVVSVFTQAFLRRIPASLHSLLPAELKVATLSIVEGPASPADSIGPI